MAKRPNLFTLDLEPRQRVALEAYRKERGLRSQAEAVRDMIDTVAPISNALAVDAAQRAVEPAVSAPKPSVVRVGPRNLPLGKKRFYGPVGRQVEQTLVGEKDGEEVWE